VGAYERSYRQISPRVCRRMRLLACACASTRLSLGKESTRRGGCIAEQCLFWPSHYTANGLTQGSVIGTGAPYRYVTSRYCTDWSATLRKIRGTRDAINCNNNNAIGDGYQQPQLDAAKQDRYSVSVALRARETRSQATVAHSSNARYTKLPLSGLRTLPPSDKYLGASSCSSANGTPLETLFAAATAVCCMNAASMLIIIHRDTHRIRCSAPYPYAI